MEVRVDAGEPAPDESHFFLAVCAHRPQIGNPTFVYVPRAANVLRERERHIALLEGELATKNEWLEKAAAASTQELMAQFAAQKEDLERSNQWAETLNRELDERARPHRRAAGRAGRGAGSARARWRSYEAKIARAGRGPARQDTVGARRRRPR